MSHHPTGTPSDDEHGSSVSRRTFLGYLIGAMSSFLGVVAGVPILGYLAGPLRSQAEANWVALGKVDDLAQQGPQVVQFTLSRRDGWVEVREARTCWVMPQGGDRFTVFNGRCTHLGCAYSWHTQGSYADQFFCPCHDGIYDRDGRVTGGPPPRPLDQLETKIENGILLVLYQDFRPGVPQKEPL
ncbi:MAG: ubiquinol-cytochrome c reductase iron-sulfur subunit [Chloroflexi bacterium]|nr:ubiquinol-cytochrome c reductase iron-sulfur subunit [Chloroflexota bacterium]